MKYILLALMLISPISFANWGDTYLCSMTSNFQVSGDGKQSDYVLENFEFNLNREKDAMVFGSSGYFAGSEMKIKEINRFISMGIWNAEDAVSDLFFNVNRISYIELTLRTAVVTADCDKVNYL